MSDEKNAVLAIVVPDLIHASVTFFHEHIARIAPGRTVVVHLSSTGAAARTDVEVLEIPQVRQWREPGIPLISTAVRQIDVWRRNRLSARQRKQVAAFLQRHKVTHLFAEFATSGVVILPVARKLGLPLTVMSHGWDINVVGQMPQWRLRYRSLFAPGTKLAAVCLFLRDQMVKTGAPSDRIAIVPCAVDSESFSAVRHEPGPVRVVMVSRLTEQKGPLYSLRAFARAAQLLPDLTLEIVGNGPLMTELQSEIGRLGIADRVRVHGDLGHADCLAVLANSHIFLQHCRSLYRQGIESQAVSLLEAMGHGLVPIVTRHGGMTDHVLPGERGWLIEEGDEEAMAAHIAAMAQDPAERSRIGRNAKCFVSENFSRDVVYPRLRRLIGLEV